MAMLKGYADDSRPNDRIWAIGGYCGHDMQWEAFEAAWPKMLAKHQVPYFHMREFGKPNGVYAKWLPAKDHYDEIAAFFADIIEVISDCWLRPYWSITRVNDMERFNAESGLALEAYPLAAYGCMLGIARDHLRGVTSELIFDHVEKVRSKLDKAAGYAESDTHYPQVYEMVVPIPLSMEHSFRNVLPLQVADFLIWEVQKNHLKIEDWFLLPDKPTDEEGRWQHMDKWSLENYGTIRPPARKSLEALAEHTAPGMGIIWDYTNISDAHRLRHGRWV